MVMIYVRDPLSLRNVEDLLFERGIDICHETVRLWWNRLGPMFAGESRRRRAQHMRALNPRALASGRGLRASTASCATSGARSTMRAR